MAQTAIVLLQDMLGLGALIEAHALQAAGGGDYGRMVKAPASMNRDWETASSQGDLGRVAALLDDGADINALDRHNQTALIHAAHRGDLALVRLLVQRGADLDRAATHGMTALMLAVIGNHPEVVEVLLAAGADASRRMSKNAGVNAALTAMELARGPEHEEILGVLRRFVGHHVNR